MNQCVDRVKLVSGRTGSIWGDRNLKVVGADIPQFYGMRTQGCLLRVAVKGWG